MSPGGGAHRPRNVVKLDNSAARQAAPVSVPDGTLDARRGGAGSGSGRWTTGRPSCRWLAAPGAGRSPRPRQTGNPHPRPKSVQSRPRNPQSRPRNPQPPPRNPPPRPRNPPPRPENPPPRPENPPQRPENPPRTPRLSPRRMNLRPRRMNLRPRRMNLRPRRMNLRPRRMNLRPPCPRSLLAKR
jgi:hypothetical protein